MLLFFFGLGFILKSHRLFFLLLALEMFYIIIWFTFLMSLNFFSFYFIIFGGVFSSVSCLVIYVMMIKSYGLDKVFF